MINEHQPRISCSVSIGMFPSRAGIVRPHGIDEIRNLQNPWSIPAPGSSESECVKHSVQNEKSASHPGDAVIHHGTG